MRTALIVLVIAACSAPARAETDPEIERCARAIIGPLARHAREDTPVGPRQTAMLRAIGRSRCGAIPEALRDAALRASRARSRERELIFFPLIDDGDDAECRRDGASQHYGDVCLPQNPHVRAFETGQGVPATRDAMRLFIVRVVDALSRVPALVPLAQIVWSLSDYDGGCMTFDISGVLEDVSHRRWRAAPYPLRAL